MPCDVHVLVQLRVVSRENRVELCVYGVGRKTLTDAGHHESADTGDRVRTRFFYRLIL